MFHTHTHAHTYKLRFKSLAVNLYLDFDRSFNDKPVHEAASGPIGKELFEKEQEDLLTDLKDIPKKACDRRVSDCYHIYKEFSFLELAQLYSYR